MPSCGELGYIVPKLYDINNTISKLNSAYKVGVELSTNYGYYWSSTEDSNYSAMIVWAGDYGYVNSGNKSNGYCVRAFMRL